MHPAELANQVKALVDLVVNPGQTETTLRAGELNYAQLRDVVLTDQDGWGCRGRGAREFVRCLMYGNVTERIGTYTECIG